MGTIRDFTDFCRIKATAQSVDRNPNMDDLDMDHWRVVLRSEDARMTVYFSKGRGHKGAEPTAEEVLDCLASDAATVENAESFEDWCGEYGYDTDSRKAHRTYTVCKRQAERLLRFLGPNAYDDLLWHTERM